jgi:hypothetical protein
MSVSALIPISGVTDGEITRPRLRARRTAFAFAASDRGGADVSDELVWHAVVVLHRRLRFLAVATLASFAMITAADAVSVGEIVDAASVNPAATARSTVTSCAPWPMTFSTERTSEPLTEVSGIVGSRLHPDLWWVHNDSGDSARALLIDSSLKIVAEVRLDGVFALDFEDIAIDGTGRVWLSDSGDNLKVRPSAQLYGFAEVDRSTGVEPIKIEVTYPDKAHDVETLMIDPRSGDGFLVDKRIHSGKATVFRIPSALFAAGGSVTAEVVGEIDVSDGGDIGPTGGDISPDGSTIVIKTLTTAYLWNRPRNRTIAETLADNPVAPCVIPSAGDNEAIGFDRDGKRLAALAEGTGTRLRTFVRQL